MENSIHTMDIRLARQMVFGTIDESINYLGDE